MVFAFETDQEICLFPTLDLVGTIEADLEACGAFDQLIGQADLFGVDAEVFIVREGGLAGACRQRAEQFNFELQRAVGGDAIAAAGFPIGLVRWDGQLDD